MKEKIINPFLGLRRKRLPGMHLITAREGGMPLVETLGALFFAYLHDKVPHNCCLSRFREDEENYRKKIDQAISRTKNPDVCVFLGVLGTVCYMDLALKEWSYLDSEVADMFKLLAAMAIEETQRSIAQGNQKPFNIPLGDLVERPEWAKQYFGDPKNQNSKAKALVEKLRQEVERDFWITQRNEEIRRRR